MSFAGPIGLYIDDVDLSGFQVPGDGSATELMRVVRGDAEHMMRVAFEAPPGAAYVLGDVMVDGDRIAFGGQIAEKITVRVRGIVRDLGEVPPSITCAGTPVPEVAELAIGVAGTRSAGVVFLTSPE